jgi:CelD/BcsL family acetyltransferase involved in cellulose biosynthesis
MAELGMAARPDRGNPATIYAQVHEKTLAPDCLRAIDPIAARQPVRQAAAEHLTLSVHTALAPIETLWTAFQEQAHTTFYQTFLWCRAWCETVGKAKNIEIRIVVASDENGGTVFILPLQVRRHYGVQVLEWLGGPHTTYGHGLFAPHFLPRSQDWLTGNWAHIVRLAGPVDAIFLADMPIALSGEPHPLQQLFNLTGPNRSHRMALSSDYGQLLAAKRSAETRRVYRKKERAFAALGDLTFGLPKTRQETHATLEIMFDQQRERLREHGIRGIFTKIERDFIHHLVDIQDESNPILLPYMLKFRGEVLSVQLGGLHANTFWAMIISLAATDLRRFSPGDLALRRTIEASCNHGLACFDFATGDTEYKLHWTDGVISLHVLLAATNLRGLPWACATGVGLVAKRLIKQSAAMRNAAMALRRALFGRRFRRGQPQD